MKKIINYAKKRFSKKLDMVILFVTSSCNAKCRHCFYWKKLNNTDDLKIEEIKKISKNLEKFNILSLSGGEPFLRKDIVEICEIFYKQNKIKEIVIPTNGIATGLILKKIKKILEKVPIDIQISFSLDGFEKNHDKNRGAKGCFKKVVVSIKELYKIKNPHFSILVNSTIMKDNLSEIEKLIEFVKTLPVDGHNFDLVRGEPKDKSILVPSKNELKEFYKNLKKHEKFYLDKKNSKEKFGGIFNSRDYLRDRHIDFLKNKRIPMKCLAGKTIFVIESNGDFKLCELLPSVGNLRDYDYDVKKILNSKKAKEQLKNIKKNCSCTHICFLCSTIDHSTSGLIKIPLSNIKRKIRK